jgi:hypothetical protein
VANVKKRERERKRKKEKEPMFHSFLLSFQGEKRKKMKGSEKL